MTERTPAANKGFAIAGVPCFADTFVQGGSSVLRIQFSAKTPHHRKPGNVSSNPNGRLGKLTINILSYVSIDSFLFPCNQKCFLRRQLF